MSIDFDTTDGRRKYLTEKLNDLLEGITESYGTVLMEELLGRLELTIKDFNDEMKDLCEQLGKKEEERQQFLEILKSGEDFSSKLKANLPIEKSDNAFIDFMESDVDLTKPDIAVDKIKSTNIDVVIDAEVENENIPEWEKKLSKLKKNKKE